MTILVTGAGGQLGNEIRILAANSEDKYIFSDVMESEDTVYIDITDYDAVMEAVRKYRVDAIVNCAAYNNVEKAESDRENARKLNTDAPAMLAGAMKAAGGLLVHFSSDYVFGGERCNVPYREHQEGCPSSVYGQTKLDGERKVAESGCSYVIVRTSWLYSEFGKNFCKTMIGLTGSKSRVKVVFDQTGTPTYALDLAKAVLVILKDYAECRLHGNAGGPVHRDGIYSKSGIYHYSNEGVCSWFDFARMVSEYYGNTSCEVTPCHSDEFPSVVTRPSYSVLDKTKIKETFGIAIPYWTDSLKHCIGNILKM